MDRREYLKSWRAANKDHVSAYDKARKTPEIRRASRLRVYNITIDKYNKLLEKQSHQCAICHIKQEDLPYVLCVDHDHKTQQVRGLLCNACNTALGLLKENPEIILRALKYLQSYTR